MTMPHDDWETIARLAKWAAQELRHLEGDMAAWQARAVKAEAEVVRLVGRRLEREAGWPQDILLLPDGAGVRFLVEPGNQDAGWIDVVFNRPSGGRPYCEVVNHWAGQTEDKGR